MVGLTVLILFRSLEGALGRRRLKTIFTDSRRCS